MWWAGSNSADRISLCDSMKIVWRFSEEEFGDFQRIFPCFDDSFMPYCHQSKERFGFFYHGNKERYAMDEIKVLQILLGEFYEKLTTLKNFVVRDAKFPQAENKIKVVIGMRRSGKTYFLYQHILKLLSEGVSRSRILYINFEDERVLPLDQQKLGRLIDAFYALYPENHENKCYIFLDEIHVIDGWQLVVRRLHNAKNAEIFLTGSSAKLLSKEIATSLRGRSLATEIWPYSFSEFLRAKHIDLGGKLYDKKTEDVLHKTFLEYLSIGGFPEVISYNAEVRRQTLQEYLDLVIFRDIIERHAIKTPSIIKNMTLSMAYNVGKPFTINKFYNQLKSQGYQSSKDVLYDYADFIEDSYVAFSVPLYDSSIRKVQTNPKKIYAIDPGLARAMTLDYENDLGRIFENVIYLELRRLGCVVHYYLTKSRYEVDFLVQTPQGNKKLFQVVWKMEDAQTLKREDRALREGMISLKIDGEIITLDSYLRSGIVLD